METPCKPVVATINRNTIPLCFLNNGLLVCYKNGSLIQINSKGVIADSFSIKSSTKNTIMGRIKLLGRLFRLGIRTAVGIGNNRIVYSVGNSIFEYEFLKREQSKGYFCERGVRPLVFTEIKGIEGFDDGVYFGAYIGRLEKKPVNIYRRTGIDSWEIAYTFSEGLVNHIHNIIPDPYRNCLWVLTGDFGEAAAIWKVTDNFQKVERVVCNNQKYRGCVAFALPEGILYATDSPLEENHIYLLNTADYSTRAVTAISGSCIYGCQWKDGYVFSTTVEPTGKYKNKLDFLFHWKIGPGIKDRYTRIYYGTPDKGFDVIHKEKKDLLPFVFQFGSIKFPAGRNFSSELFFMPVATKKHDLDLMKIAYNNEHSILNNIPSTAD